MAALLLAGAARLAAAQEAPAADPESPDVFSPAPEAHSGDPPPDPVWQRWVVGRTPAVFRPDGLATRVGGWLDASYQASDRAADSLDLNHFNLYFDTRLGRTWQLFAEFEFENQPAARGFEAEREYEVEQLYGRWLASDALAVRAGQFNTPFGIWTPLHWSILMDTISEPIHEGTRVTPEQQVGAEIAGRIFLHERLGLESELAYSLYSGYGSPGELTDEQGTQGLSLGGDLRLRIRQANLLGVSLYQQRRELRDGSERSERSLMLYGEWRASRRLLLRSELLRQWRGRRVGPQSRRIHIGYLAARWELGERAYLAYRYGFGDDEAEGSADERRAHTITLGLRPSSSLRLKLEYARNELGGGERSSFQYAGVSVGLLF